VIEARPTASAAAQASITRELNASQQLSVNLTVANSGG
jgi:hypothetical protein